MKLEIQPIIVGDFSPVGGKLDRFLAKKDVLHVVGFGNTILYKLIGEGRFPRQIKFKHCTNVVWSEFAVYQWMEEQKNGGVE